jgi:predicted transcriptional regulator
LTKQTRDVNIFASKPFVWESAVARRREQPLGNLSRRERQIVDIVYRRGHASAAQVREDLHDAPSYSSVRTFLSILEEKGHLKHVVEGGRYIYSPTRRRERVGRAALRRVLQTFYQGSVEKTMAALLDVSESQLSREEIDRLAALIDEAREEGR